MRGVDGLLKLHVCVFLFNPHMRGVDLLSVIGAAVTIFQPPHAWGRRLKNGVSSPKYIFNPHMRGVDPAQ